MRPAEATEAAWLADLRGTGASHDDAVRRLHTLLLRMARAEAARRSGWNHVQGRELDDVAEQAADDATISVLRKVTEFRGDSRFTTWACAFVIREVSGKLGRHVWRRDGVRFDDDGWDVQPAGPGTRPEAVVESRELVVAVRHGVRTELTDHQRRVFLAIAVHGTPLDALAAELGSNRNAIYKTMFDARRKLRTYLVRHGHLDPEVGP